MALSIKNKETEALARELARITRKPITQAVHDELQRGLARAKVVARNQPESAMVKRIMEISKRSAKRPTISDLTEDEILGYDAFGAPTK